nr:ribonuclease H-like domain-containing protein [Tanacetum cinerariifolium]
MHITSVEEKAQRRLAVKSISTLMMGIPNEHQLKFNSIKDATQLLEAIEKRFGGNPATKKTQRNLLTQQYENFTVNTANEVSTASTQVNVAFTTNIDNLSDASDQAEEGPNYALMAFTSLSSDSKVSNDLNCLKSCLETVKLLKSQNEQLLKDLKKFELMVLEIAIKELRMKLKIAQKEKDGIQITVDKLKNASKGLNKLIECQIVDNCKKGLWYENYNAVPTPYTGNFMPSTPDLSFTRLDEFDIKPVAENTKSCEEETKVVRKNDDALIIEEWVSDDEEENVTQPKIVKKTVRPNIVEKKFVKPRQQEKTARKIVKKVKHNRQNTHRPRDNQRN